MKHTFELQYPDPQPGQRYGHRVVQRFVEKRKGHKYYECLCDCGKTTITAKDNLLNHESCGCMTPHPPHGGVSTKGIPRPSLRNDLSGQRFGKLIAIRDVGANPRGYRLWECQCDCGNKHVVSSQALRAGQTRSCGCLIHELLIDRTGYRIGKLTVISYVGKVPGKMARDHWLCQCACGQKKVFSSSALFYGKRKAKSCGCVPKTKDLTNQRFGRLTALHPTDKRFHRSVVWHCRCDCGNELDVTIMYLTAGTKRSCGCLRKGRPVKEGP